MANTRQGTFESFETAGNGQTPFKFPLMHIAYVEEMLYIEQYFYLSKIERD